MTPTTFVRVGPAVVALRAGDLATPVTRALTRLPAARPADPHLTIDLRPPTGAPSGADRRLGHQPVRATSEGIAVVDHLGRAAELHLHRPDGPLATVDPHLDLHVFQSWVQLPLFRRVLQARGGALARCTVIDLKRRRIAVVAPARTGKTQLVLALLDQGADLVGDDWVAVAPDGSVAAACGLVVLRDEAAGGRRVHPRRLAVAAARIASRRTARWRRLSLALGAAGDLAWRWGQRVTDIAELRPGARLSEPQAPIDEVLLLDTPVAPTGAGEADAGALAARCAAAARWELPEEALVDAAVRLLHPGRDLAAPASLAEEIARLERAFAGALVRRLPHDGTRAGLARLLSHFATTSPPPPTPGAPR